MSQDHPVIEFSLLGLTILIKRYLHVCWVLSGGQYLSSWVSIAGLGLFLWTCTSSMNDVCSRVNRFLVYFSCTLQMSSKPSPVSRKLTPLLQQIHLGFSGGYAYTYQQYTPLGTLSMQRNTLLGVYMENAEKELFLWHGVVKARWAPLRIGRILTLWFSVCDLYMGNPYAFHNFWWATEILTLKPQVDRGSSTMAEPVIVWKTDKS